MEDVLLCLSCYPAVLWIVTKNGWFKILSNVCAMYGCHPPGDCRAGPCCSKSSWGYPWRTAEDYGCTVYCPSSRPEHRDTAHSLTRLDPLVQRAIGGSNSPTGKVLNFSYLTQGNWYIPRQNKCGTSRQKTYQKSRAVRIHRIDRQAGT